MIRLVCSMLVIYYNIYYILYWLVDLFDWLIGGWSLDGSCCRQIFFDISNFKSNQTYFLSLAKTNQIQTDLTTLIHHFHTRVCAYLILFLFYFIFLFINVIILLFLLVITIHIHILFNLVWSCFMIYNIYITLWLLLILYKYIYIYILLTDIYNYNYNCYILAYMLLIILFLYLYLHSCSQ